MPRIDARTLETGTTIQADVCVIGAGAAGISIARELGGTSLRVCVLESGGMEPDKETTRLYKGKVTVSGTGTKFYVSRSRLRYFGGTTNHWDGACAPVEPSDLSPADWLPNPGWPVDRPTLDPFYARAAAILSIHPFDYGVGDLFARGMPTYDLSPESGLFHRPFQFSSDRRFKSKFGDEVFSHDNVNVYLWANAVELVPHADGPGLSHVEVRTLEGQKELSVQARYYVLATGGLENARLLLASRSVQEAGLGNQHDLVGRFFMDHVYFSQMTAVVVRKMKTFKAYRRKKNAELGGRAQVVLSFTPEFRRKHGLLDSQLRLEYPPKKMPDLYEAIARTTRILTPKRGRTRYLSVRLITELAPDPDNRVTLQEETDALGLPRIHLNWKLTELDRTSIEKTTRLFARVAPVALGARVHISPYQRRGRIQSHHIGTTRMSADPKLGVVDAQCRVHGLDNLYVAGSSVFPTSTAVNPTFTILALALRIADHIKAQAA
jgi:choline dehydrogenase-like flavoprotein